jgi:hypothetical protein
MTSIFEIRYNSASVRTELSKRLEFSNILPQLKHFQLVSEPKYLKLALQENTKRIQPAIGLDRLVLSLRTCLFQSITHWTR